jgi:hypothetical protein
VIISWTDPLLRVHHSLMSASDAAPLPRLGEVFFDVRGSSRSMRLSWYSDTGVAVFSIWQGGMCTGTFRLPIGDLPRMIEILQRGPDDQRSPAGDHRGPAVAQRAAAGDQARPRQVGGERSWREPAEAGLYAEGTGQYDSPPGGQPASPQREQYESPLRGERYREGYGQPRLPYGPDELGDDRNRGYQLQVPAEQESAGHQRDDSDYGQERFVPPYVRGSVSEYSGDIPRHPAGRMDDHPPPAYRDPLAASRSGPADSPRDPWPPPGYSDGPGYRLGSEPERSPDEPAAPPSAGRHGKYPLPGNTAGQPGYLDQPEDFEALTDDYPAWRGR